MESRESAASRETEALSGNGAESMEDLNECESAETEDNNDAASGTFFPPEVLTEILCWLPIRSLAKVQLVSKAWQGFIHCRYLTERNMDCRKFDSYWHTVVVQVPVDPAKPEESITDGYALLDGCDGLLLLGSYPEMKLSIWNPATSCVLNLPDPHKNSFGVTLSYVKSTGKHHMFSLFEDESGRKSCEVLTPGQSKSWRPLALPDVMEGEGRKEKPRAGVVLTGEAVHTVLVLKVGSTVTHKVMSLDLATESFIMTCFVKTKAEDLEATWPIDWNGKLALTTYVGSNLHVTVLEDCKKQLWCQEDLVIPLSCLKEDMIISLVPLFAKDGMIWFNYKEHAVLIYKIKTRRYTSLSSRGLLPNGKLYPYKPTLVGLPGMHLDAKFGHRWAS